MDNQFDNSDPIVHNEDKDESVYEVIRMSEKTPLNDPLCEHELVEDSTDLIGDFVAHVCPKCGIGKFLPRVK